MREVGTGVEFGLTADSRAGLRGVSGRFIKFDALAALQTQKAVEELAIELLAAVRKEFQPHDRSPTSFDGSPATGRIRSIDTLRVESGPMWAKISMGGGAPYVETGTAPHIISVRAAGQGAASAVSFTPGGTQTGFASPGATGVKALHWVGPEGDMFATTVHSPGYRGDPFLERAMHDIDLDAQLGRLASDTFSRLFPDLASSHGSQFERVVPA